MAPSNGTGGWQVAGTQNIHMQVVDLTTGQYVPLYLPTMYFGLPVYRSNGEYYSESEAQLKASQAVKYAEEQVMARYRSLGGAFDIVGMTLLYKQKMNEKMQQFGGSASLIPGSNINITDLGQANYGWPIIGCD